MDWAMAGFSRRLPESLSDRYGITRSRRSSPGAVPAFKADAFAAPAIIFLPVRRTFDVRRRDHRLLTGLPARRNLPARRSERAASRRFPAAEISARCLPALRPAAPPATESWRASLSRTDSVRDRLRSRAHP